MTVATATLTPLVGSAGPAAAAPAAVAAVAGPDCSAEDQAFQEAANARDEAAADLASYLAGEYADARAARQQALTAKNQATQAKDDAQAAVDAATDAYNTDPTPENEQALADAARSWPRRRRRWHRSARRSRKPTRRSTRPPPRRKEKAGVRNSKKAAAMAARAIAEACPTTKPYATVSNLQGGGPNVTGDVTFGNLAAGATYRIANFAEDCYSYGCGVTSNSGSTERTLFGSYLGVCDNVGTNTYRFFNFSNGQYVFDLTVDYSSQCVV